MSPEAKTKSVWENRFARPKAADLLAELPKTSSQLIDGLRAAYKSAGLREDVSWQGIPWRWSFVFTPAESSPAAAIGLAVYLIPAPAKVEVAMTFSDAILAGLSGKKQPKTLREALAASSLVGAKRFVRWELASKAQLDEIVALTEQVIRPAEGSKAEAKSESKGEAKSGSKR